MDKSTLIQLVLALYAIIALLTYKIIIWGIRTVKGGKYTVSDKKSAIWMGVLGPISFLFMLWFIIWAKFIYSDEQSDQDDEIVIKDKW